MKIEIDFKQLNWLAFHFCRLASQIPQPEEAEPFSFPEMVDAACIKTDPRSGVQILLVLKDGEFSLKTHRVQALIRIPEYPHDASELSHSI